jgi:long-chain acyl-CoA synthetase
VRRAGRRLIAGVQRTNVVRSGVDQKMLRTRPLNRLRAVFDSGLTPANLVDRAAAAHPDLPLFHPDEESVFLRLQGAPVTPRRLRSFASRLGAVLHEAGMQPGDRVAIVKRNHVDYFFCVLAVVRAGGVAVPVNPGVSAATLDGHVRSTGARLVVTDAETLAACVGDPEALPTVETWLVADPPSRFPAAHVDLNQALERAPDDLPPADVARSAPVIVAHTSGTTGVPKATVSTAATIVGAVKGHYVDEPITTRNRTGIAGHFSHLVYQPGLYASLLAAMPVWTMSPFDERHVLRTIERERLNIFFAFPDVFLRMQAAGLDRYDLSSMRIWIATADASHDVQMNAFCTQGAYLRVLGVPVVRSLFIEVLGSSEVGSGALRRIRFSFSRPRSDRLIGRPSPGGPRVRIADDAGRTARVGAVGRLMVRGPTIFRGYWGDGRSNGANGDDGWVWTGDVAYRDRLRRFHHLDRATDVVETRNGPVYTLPVEEVLLRHPEVGEVAVVGLPHPEQGQVPVAIAHAKPGGRLASEECLAWARERLRVATPLAAVIAVAPDELPRGLTGKVLKRELRERYFAHFGGASSPSGLLRDQAGTETQH